MKFTECPDLGEDLNCVAYCNVIPENGFICCFFCKDFSHCDKKTDCLCFEEVVGEENEE